MISARTLNRSRRMFSTMGPLLKKSPEEILEAGFKKMQSPSYKKSDEQLPPLINAGKEIGVSEKDIKELYFNTRVGAVPYDQMTPDQRMEEAKKEIELLQPPTLDEPFQYDELPPLGHLQLHEHRVQREYVRIASYDLPQLTKYASDYCPPSKKDILRFKYTTYLGEEHDAEKKVVVTFKTEDLGLEQKQLHKLRLLAGSRYNSGKDEVKISSSRYPDQAQNKRFLGQVVQDLIAKAKDTSDDFSDIPLDNRHIEPKIRRNRSIYPQYEFPKEWERPQDAPQEGQDLISRILKA